MSHSTIPGEVAHHRNLDRRGRGVFPLTHVPLSMSVEKRHRRVTSPRKRKHEIKTPKEEEKTQRARKGKDEERASLQGTILANRHEWPLSRSFDGINKTSLFHTARRSGIEPISIIRRFLVQCGPRRTPALARNPTTPTARGREKGRERDRMDVRVASRRSIDL